ncbi:MAG: DUF4390 domain-containing protein [Spirochaetes bacterium]|nr:DUF4390 domain-containing protein [Spirochaetota bacterium]
MRRFFLLVLFLLLSSGLFSDFILNKPQIILKDGFLYLHLFVDRKIPYRIISTIEDGIKVKFIYEIKWMKKISFFLSSDKIIFTKNLYYTISLNFLEGRYVLFNSLDKKTRYFSKRINLIKAMTSWNFIKLIRFYELESEKAYYIKARVLIKSVKLYPPFSLLSILSIETDWKRSGDVIR